MKEINVPVKKSGRQTKVQKSKLFKGLLKIIKDISTTDWKSLPADTLDIIDSIKLDETNDNIAYKLLSRSLIDSLLNLIVENALCCEKEDIVSDELDERLASLLNSEEVVLDKVFFNDPSSSPFLEKASPIIKQFLLNFQITDNEANNILRRLPSYFLYSLTQEWQKNYKYYQVLKESLNTPFDEAVKKDSEWFLYSKWLYKQVNSPVFSETFGLSQVYVPLRAYYRKKESKQQALMFEEDQAMQDEHKKIVINLENELLLWIEKGDKSDGLRVIRGGPGYGKSTFLKIFASNLSGSGKKVLFIPLHRFEIKDDLVIAIQNFLRYDNFLTFDPLEEERLIIMFDGLDELSMQGKVLAEIANQFIREVDKKISNFNSQKIRIQVIISGRDVIVQQNENELRKEGQILSLLPYYISEAEREEFHDSTDLLKEDQRTIWWRKYGEAKGKRYNDIPAELNGKELEEVTAQPLLNYLVALSFERGKIDFSSKPNLNEIYHDLLEAVYNRGYSEAKTHHTIKKFELPNFIRILEEIATAAWHGNGRTTTVAEIESHFLDSGLKKLLDDFVKDAEKGMLSLLTAFYFRQAGQNIAGSQTFEFTHKSFGEYLTAKRIVNKLWQIHNKLHENESNYDEGWNIPIALTEWLKLFGPKEIDPDLLGFIKNEIKLKFQNNTDEIKNVQQSVIKLINYVLKEGMPLEKKVPRPSFKEEYEQSINSEKSLLILLSLTSGLSGQLSELKWPTPTSFGEWIGRLLGQRTGPFAFILLFLNELNIDRQVLDLRDFYGANFKNSSMVGTHLHYAILVRANLDGASLVNSRLGWSRWESSSALNANFSYSHLEGATFEEATLDFANFTNANIQGANFKKTNLVNVNLENAHPSRKRAKSKDNPPS